MDFKNSDISTGPIISDLNSADAAVALESAATLAVALQAGNILPLTADGQLVLPAGVGLDDIKVVGRDLVIQMPDGTQMVVPDGAIFVPEIVVDGVAVPPLNIAALLIGQEPQPAAGRPQSSGGNFADNVGDIGDPFGLGDLLPPTQLAFPGPEVREIIPYLNDEEPTTIIITPDQPAGSVSATASVNEAALSARGLEPAGSNETSNAETTTGSIVFEAADGLASITLNGTAITAVGQVFVTPLGRLTITSIAPGNIGYSYTLIDNTTNPASNDIFAVVVTDTDGDTASANLTINIVDDVPTARNDTDSVPAANYTGQIGNVITGVGTTSGNAGADTQGADGAVLSGIRAGTATGTFAAAGTTINGQYGTLTISANGSYTYTRNAGTPGGVNDVFTYQLTDGDGDTSTATLTIAIADSPAVITFVPTTGDGTIVSEVGLPARGSEPPGSNPALPVETTSGTITYVAPDGPATVQINGVTITASGQTITTPTGILTITSIAPGAIGYSFTLTDNTAGDATTQTFTITVTDLDGDAATAPLTITIVDDVPTARNDSATQAVENTPVTVNVIANDTQGADGVSLTTGVALVAGSLTGTGSVVYNNNGTFTYTPGAGEEGTVTFQYRIADGDGDPSTATVTITLARDSVPFIEISGERSVAEAGLPARGTESAGSNTAANSETTTGTINVGTGNDTVGSLVINGVNVTAGGTVVGASGTLTVTLSAGVYNYSYTLTDNTSGNSTTDSFTVVLTDSDGDVASSNLVIAIADDVPTAIADTDSVAAGSYAPATGNVITDAEADGGKDTQGADGVVVTAISGSGAGTVGGATSGAFGILTLNADGSYSYARNAGTPGGVSDVFTYTITDGDGDTSTTTLTIAIADSPTSLDLPTRDEAGTSVDEAGLPTGSNAAAESETTNGTIAYTAPDGPATVTIDGVAVTSVGQTFAGAFGTMTITSIANGAIGYSYTLTTNTSGDATFEDFAVVVTDQDGDNTTGTLVIDIVDDVPTARADSDSVTEDDFSGDSESVSADGNVITGVGGSDANTTDGIADTKGADGASVTAVAFGDAAGTIGSSTAGAYGGLVLNADGSYTYTLNNFDPVVQGLDGDDTLTEVFTYTLTDGDGDARTTTLTITINGSDDPISINGLNLEGPELTVDEDDLSDGSSPNAPALTQSGSFTVNGVDGIASVKVAGVETFVGQTFTTAHGTFTITSISAPANGNSTSITVGYSYVLTDNLPHPGSSGQNSVTESFSVTVTDTDGSTDTDSIDVRIIDDVPTAANDTDTVLNGSSAPATGNVITDAEGDGGKDTVGADGALVTAISGAGAGTVGGTTAGTYGVLTLNADGSYSYTRNDGTPGNVSDVFTYTITDSDGDTSTATLTINIEDARPIVGANATVLLDDDAKAGGNPGGTGDDVDAANTSGTLSGSGGDGALTWAYQLSGAPAGFSYVANGSNIEVFQGAIKVLTITLNSANGSYMVTQNAPILHADGGAENNQAFTISYTVTDIDGDATSGTLSINVDDDSPIAVNDGQTTIEGAPAVTGNVLGNDQVGADTPGAVTLVGAAAIGTNTVIVGTFGTLTISANGAYSYVPKASVPSGSVDSFTYTMRDADGDTSAATLTFTYNGDANRPTAGTTDASVDDDAIGGNAGGTGDLPDGNADGDNNQATFSGTLPNNFGLDGAGKVSFANLHNLFGVVGTESVQYGWNEGTSTLTATGPRGVLFTVVINQATGAYTLTLLDNVLHNGGAAENDASVVLSYVVTDSDGSAATGTLNVTFDDDTPTATADTDAVTEDGTTSATGNVLTGVGTDGNAAGADSLGADGAAVGGAVVAVAGGSLGVPIVGTYGSLTLNANGTYSFVLNNSSAAVQGLDSGETATQIYTYTIRDGDGDETTATLTITINGTNDAPVVNADTNWTVEDAAAAITGNVLNTVAHNGAPDAVARGDVADTDVDVETLTVTTTGAINGLYGTLTLNANGSYSYSLYTQAQNAAAYALIQARDVGDPPLNDVFNYTATDGTAPVSSTLTIAVFGANDAPVANPDTNWTVEDAAAAITGNVLNTLAHNGAPDAALRGDVADTDVDVETLTVTTTGTINGLYGILTLNADGSYSYALYTQAQNPAAYALIQARDAGDPPLNDVFNYTVTDGTAPVGSTLTIAVFGANDAPVANPDTNWVLDVTTGPNPAASGNVLQSLPHNGAPAGTFADVADTDIDVETLTVTTTGSFPGTYGTLVLNADGSYTYTLNASNAAVNALDTGETLIETFNYTASDGTASANATLTITIFGTNDAPVANPDTNWVLEDGGNATGNVLLSLPHAGAPAGVFADVADTDVDVEPLTVTAAVIVGTYGTLTLNANGSYSYALNNANPLVQALDTGDAPLTDIFNYTASDGTASAGSTLTISIFGTNDAPVLGTGTAVISEEGLTGGIPDTTGTPTDTTNSVTASGTISITDVDNEPQTVTLGDPGAVLTADGLTVTWTGVGTGALTGRVETSPGVFVNVITVTINNSGAYTVTLLQSVDHPTVNVEDIKTFTVPVNVNDGTVTVGTTLAITIEDDRPTAANDPNTTIEGGAAVTGNVLTNDSVGADSPLAPNALGVVTTTGTFNLGHGSLTINANGTYSYTPNASVPSGTIDSFTYTMRDSDGDTATATLSFTFNGDANLPTAGTTSASVDDDALTGGIANGTGDLADANADGDNNQATFAGTLPRNFGLDGPGVVTLSNMNGATATIGTELVTYGWNAGTNTLTATGPRGALFTVVINPSTGAYTLTLLDNVLHASGGDENDATAALTYQVTDSDGSVAAGTLNITFDDDTPNAVAPVAITVINGASAPVVQSLDVDNNVANNYGADSGTVQFAPTLNGANSGLTSNFVPIIYTLVNGQTLVGKAGATTVFTITLNPATSQYSVDMDGKIDSTTTIDFNNGAYNFVGGNNSWSEFIPVAESVGAPIDNNSQDLLLTPSVSGAPNGTINSTANTGGISGGASVGTNETFRVDFVTDLRGNPADGAGDYGTAANRDHVFDGHYTVNGASALFKSSGGSTVKITTFDDADGNNVVGDGVKDTINGLTIAYFGVASAIIIPTTTATNYTVNGHVFTVTLNVDGSVNVAGVAGDSGSSLQGTVIAVFTASGYNSVEYTYQSGDTFQIGDFGATTLTNNPVTFTVPVQVIDGDGDVSANSNLSITANSAPPVVLDLDGDGVEFVPLSAGVAFDYHGDGSADPTAWVGADDGILAIDRNGDGVVNDGSEIIFGSSSRTDLQGLAANYDSNHDGMLSASDDSFALFGVWQDANGNGVTDAGEFRSLSDAGIVSIALVSDGIAYSAANGQVSVAGQSTFTKADGSTGIVADAAFATGAAPVAQNKAAEQVRSFGNVTTSVVAASLVGLAIEENAAAAAPDRGLVHAGLQIGENMPVQEQFHPLADSGIHLGGIQQAFGSQVDDFVQRTGDVDSSMRAVTEPDYASNLASVTTPQMSDLLHDSADIMPTGNANPALSFGGSFGGADMVMGSILDLAAAGPAMASNDNPVTAALDDIVRQAMPETTVDHLIEAFDTDLGATEISHGGSSNDNGHLLEIINQSVSSSHDYAMINVDLMGPQFHDMTTINNG